MAPANNTTSQDYEFDIALSFAGEDRPYVDDVAEALKLRGIRCFYDLHQEVNLWGKDLYQYLDDLYKNKARYCVVFLSENYSKKLWTNHELRSAQERAFAENQEYILPARFDDSSIPGIRATIGYIDLNGRNAKEFAELIIKKLEENNLTNFHMTSNYFPPNPDKLFKAVMARKKNEKYETWLIAVAFLRTLTRMTSAERELIYSLIFYGCPHDFPENWHIDIDLLNRITGIGRAAAIRTAKGIQSLGFSATICNADGEEIKTGRYLYMRWESMSLEVAEREIEAPFQIAVASTMIEMVGASYCDTHRKEALEKLNFSCLSSATAVEDQH